MSDKEVRMERESFEETKRELKEIIEKERNELKKEIKRIEELQVRWKNKERNWEE